MFDNISIGVSLVIWGLAILFLFFSRRIKKISGSGLLVAYIINLWLIHWPGALLYVFPWYVNPNFSFVRSGFVQSTYAIVAFVIGSILLAPVIAKVLRIDLKTGTQRTPEPALAKMYILAGILCFFVLLPVLGRIPTVTALIAAGWNLTAVGLGLNCWKALRDGNSREFRKWILLAACLPFLTIFTQGFLGFGFAAFLSVFSLVVAYYRPRAKLVVLSILFFYFGLCFYDAYMRDRNDIREIVWGHQGLEKRIDQMFYTVTHIEFFDPYNNVQLARFDDRMNQNYLVGAAVHYLESGSQTFARGQTLIEAAQAVIPRFLWLNKPVFAGSPEMVSTYTGIAFNESTSVGVGQVMEFYINFGTPGVFVGFIILGALLTVIDTAAGERLIKGNWYSFTLWYLPGLSFLQVGGSLVEVTSSAGAACATAFLANKILYQLRGRRLSVSAGMFESSGHSDGLRTLSNGTNERVRVLGLLPSTDDLGGIQTSGRIAWQAITEQCGAEDTKLVAYSPTGSGIFARPQKASAAFQMIRQRASAELILVWQIGLLKLYPFLSGNKTALFLHGIEAWRHPTLALRRLLKHVDLFLTNSQLTWERFAETHPMHQDVPYRVVPLGLGDPVAPNGCPDPAPAALMLSRLIKSEDYKGHREMLAAWPFVLKQMPQAQLWIAGDGDLRPELESLVNQAGLENSVRFYGLVTEEEKQGLLVRSRCLAMPSRNEGFGLVYLEAMRLGRPCLVSNLDAGREVVNPPEAGLAVTPDRPEEVASAMLRLISCDDEWKAWSVASRQRYEKHFTADRFKKRLLEALELS